jgi:hypothetical protein
MTSTLNPACPLCGLRYASKPLLELHIREDHRPRRRAQPGRLDAGGTGVSSPPAGRPSRRSGLASRPSRTAKEVTAMTATRRPRLRRVMTVPRRALRALRHANDELTRASEAIIRSPAHRSPARRSRRPRPGTPTRVPRPNARAGPPDRAARGFPPAMTAPAGQHNGRRQAEGSPAARPDAGAPTERAAGTALAEARAG